MILEVIVSLIILILVYKNFSTFNYWKKLGVPYIDHYIPILGNVDLYVKSVCDYVNDLYWQYPNEKYYGTYKLWKPLFIVKDPELIQNLTIKDFSYFYNRNETFAIDTNSTSKNLTNYHDEQWKSLRSKLTPIFSSGKMKGMHGQVVNCAMAFVKYLSQYKPTDCLEFKDLCGRFSMDVISSSAFGMDLDIMNNPNSEFYKIGKKLLEPSYANKIIFFLLPFLSKVYRFFHIDQLTKKERNFFENAIDQAIDYRKDNNIKRLDFLNMMNELMKKDAELIKKNVLDPNDQGVFDHHSLISNSFVFFTVGFESTGMTLSFVLYQMALHPEIQEQIHDHVLEVLDKHDGELTHESVNELTQLDHVLSETMRLLPPAVNIERKVTRDYQLPGTNLVLPKGTEVFIPMYGMHFDPQYFPEPYLFKPERFDPEKNSLTKNTFLPFGSGPRSCIATRFSKHEIKTCAALLLKHYKFSANAKTEVPLQLDDRTVLLVPKNGVWLSIEPRNVKVV